MRYEQTPRNAGDLQVSPADGQPCIHDQTPVKILDIKCELSWLALLHAYYHSLFPAKVRTPYKTVVGRRQLEPEGRSFLESAHLPLLLADLILYPCHKL